MDNQQTIIGVVIAIIVLLMIRDLICWFWKINKIVSKLESIDANFAAVLLELKQINGNVPLTKEQLDAELRKLKST